MRQTWASAPRAERKSPSCRGGTPAATGAQHLSAQQWRPPGREYATASVCARRMPLSGYLPVNAAAAGASRTAM